MDDRTVFRLATLKLAYRKQLYFIAALIVLTFIGVGLYVFTIYQFNFGLLITGVAFAFTGVIGIMTVDQKLKNISKKIRELE
ncbi:MAG: hypothetical protein WC916_01505 [Candidatus Woesearchaeota archaeon]